MKMGNIRKKLTEKKFHFNKELMEEASNFIEW
uniref:Uncharacterized protein n=1 Tax=Onchocerca volvulus TaxID=6282 RepID=A0A8R1TMU6_ONCVO